jgi:RNA polymerase sigma-70 factor, ECF subfamily
MQNQTDAQLVARTRAGDIKAFEVIVERYRAPLVARATARLGSLADGEDVAQEAFVRAYFRLHELREPAALLGWLRKMTDRLALMHLRKRQEETLAPESMELATCQDDRQQQALADIETRGLLVKLSAGMREAVILTTLSGYTCTEAAAIMGVKEGTVKSRLSRARNELREAYGMTHATNGGKADSNFTHKTIERLKKEARQLAAEGKFDEATRKGEAILLEQVKGLYGDPGNHFGPVYLEAVLSGAFRPDPEAQELINLSGTEQRRHEAEANAAQYGFKLEELDWQPAIHDRSSGTVMKPTGEGQDRWGIPISRMQLTIIDARELCQRLRCSPISLYQWVKDGCPILRCRPFARFDFDRVQAWLADRGITDWPKENVYMLERPARVLMREVYAGRVTPEQADEIRNTLGYGVWLVPMPGVNGGWEE